MEDIGRGSIPILLRAKVVHGDKDYSPDVHHRFTDGIQVIRREEGTPPYFTYDNVKAVRDIVRQFGRDGVTSVIYDETDSLHDELGAGEEQAELTHEIEAELNRLTGVHYHALGAIEGRVELVSVQRRWRRFSITLPRTKRAVRCSLPYDLERDVFEAIKRDAAWLLVGLLRTTSEMNQ